MRTRLVILNILLVSFIYFFSVEEVSAYNSLQDWQGSANDFVNGQENGFTGGSGTSVPPLVDFSNASKDMSDMKKPGGYSVMNTYLLAGTAYAPTAGGINCQGDCTMGAAGTKVSTYRTLAADPTVLPYGTIVKMSVPTMPEYSGLYLVEDTGGAIKDNRIDVLIEPLAKANLFGRRDVYINVVELGTGREDARNKVDNWPAYVARYSQYTGAGQAGAGNFPGSGEDDEDILIEEDRFDFEEDDVNIRNTGVDDRRVENTAQTSFVANTILSKVANFLFDVARVVSIFMMGFIFLIWTLAVLGYGGITYCYELLLKLSMNRIDVYEGGMPKLLKYTGFAFLVSVIVVSGLLPDMFALIYSMLSKLIDSAMRYRPFI